LNCPACRKEVLIAIEYDEVEVDYCVSCHGVWLDAGELELLFGNAEACAAFLTIGSPAAVPKREKARACPECDRRMRKESTEGEPVVTFDHCPRCGGMWFDEGELSAVLGHPAALGKGREVAEFLRGMFVKGE
jgi:Zn-finger nucleic acid-binding protein